MINVEPREPHFPAPTLRRLVEGERIRVEGQTYRVGRVGAGSASILPEYSKPREVTLAAKDGTSRTFLATTGQALQVSPYSIVEHLAPLPAPEAGTPPIQSPGASAAPSRWSPSSPLPTSPTVVLVDSVGERRTSEEVRTLKTNT